MDLVDISNAVAELAEREVAPYVGPPNARQLAEVIEARRIRKRMFHMDLTHPTWTFLLDLYRLHLEGDADGESLMLPSLRSRLPLERLCSMAMVRVEEGEPVLTDFGVRLMEQQFKAE